MLFNSLTFLYFFLIVIAVNAALPLRLRNAWTLLASILFYMSWSPICILLLLVTAMVDYYVAIHMAELRSGPHPERAKRWLIASLIFNLGSLGFFKYAQMALGTAGVLAGWFGADWAPPLLHVILPLGISFYTFETISYGVDVYRGELQPKRDFIQYLSFLMFFPKLIAGPIVRASELLPQISLPRRCLPQDLNRALNLILLGLVKKVILADNFAPFVERVWAEPSAHNRWMCLVAVYGYSMQVYLDFSAYSDIALGCAKLLGYDLPRNFDRPYLAVSISDFWRRWHMTLSRWLRDYLYIPLGGNQHGHARTYLNLFVTMLLGGLWHGANWTFVIWGGLNGVFLLIEKAWHDLRGTRPARPSDLSAFQRVWRGLIVFNLITFTRIFFRSPDLATAGRMMSAIARPMTVLAEERVGLFIIPAVIVTYVAASALLKTRERWLSLEFAKTPQLATLGYACALLLLFALGAGQAEFIYFQF